MDNELDFLMHYGVLGMKWGVRKDRRKKIKEYSRMSPEDRKKKYTEEKDAYSAYKFRDDMSDTELRNLLGRLNLEKQLKSFSEEQTKKGKSFVDRVLSGGKKANELYSLYNSKLFNDVREYMQKEQVKRDVRRLTTGKKRK